MIRRIGIAAILSASLAACASQPAPREKTILAHGETHAPVGVHLLDKRDLSRIKGKGHASLRPASRTEIAQILSAHSVVKTDEGFTVSVAEDVFFRHPGSKVLPENMPRLTRLAAIMLKDPELQLEILAHYHSDGRPAKAMAESQKRAVALQAALMSRGVPSERIRAIGGGEGHPVADNRDPLGQKSNRRIDFIFHK